MPYTLYNKSNDKKLIHPRVGLWFTNNLDEAREMLSSLYEYLDSCKLSEIKKDICIIDVEKNEFIN